MHFVFILCVFVLVLDILEGATICKVPNGDAGTCIDISKCKPLSDIYNKRPKTKEENKYIAQAYCGNPSSAKIKVCCPHESTWSNFMVNPVLYERPPIGNGVQQGPVTMPSKYKPPPQPATIEPAVVPLSANPNLVGTTGNQQTVTFKNQDNCGLYVFSSNKIIGGEPTGIDQYPWLVLLEYAGGILGCGGSLISSRFILTAAHCVDSINGKPQIARLAEYNITSYPIDVVEVEGGGEDQIENIFIPVESVMKHPGFSRRNLQHDIGLVKLSQDVVFSDFIKTVCLPTRDYVPEFTASTNFTVAGWGDDPSKTEFYDVKKEVDVPYVPMSKCRNTITTDLIDNQICAGGEEGKDTCKGDSGGPLLHLINQTTYIAVGVVSFGPKSCGTRGQPAVYTHVYKYLDWIAKTMEEL
ncbi:phenoloxidase-activating enzyme-like [Aricia agestis]|uniref:phenoloxidase-activating enzyme-like n=1 Tax=Aricia agestis TaxID=91739 RepID=UPI001C205752|nr:phenoloxidase-activating enzyme-like [Aricia agestis]